MLQLHDLFCGPERKGDIPILHDLSENIQFTPQDLCTTINTAATNIFHHFHTQIDETEHLTVHQKSIAIIMPNSALSVITFLAVTSLSMIACPLVGILTRSEYRFAFKSFNIELLLYSSDSDSSAKLAAEDLNIPHALVTWDRSSTLR